MKYLPPRSILAGFIAEQVAAIDPLLATYDSDGQIQGVKYPQMTAVLVNAIQEQQQQIESLKSIVCTDHPEADICL